MCEGGIRAGFSPPGPRLNPGERSRLFLPRLRVIADVIWTRESAAAVGARYFLIEDNISSDQCSKGLRRPSQYVRSSVDGPSLATRRATASAEIVS